MHPADVTRTRLTPGHLETGRGRVDRDDLQATPGEQAGERPSAASDIKHALGAELASHGGVGIQVRTVRIQLVIDLRQPGLLEDRISHGVNPAGPWPSPRRARSGVS